MCLHKEENSNFSLGLQKRGQHKVVETLETRTKKLLPVKKIVIRLLEGCNYIFFVDKIKQFQFFVIRKRQLRIQI